LSAGHSEGGRKGGTTAPPAENGLCADYPLTEAESTAKRDEWLPTERDAAHLASLMVPVIEPGKFANWIAPPTRASTANPGLRVREADAAWGARPDVSR
jgi:hypothetical protein